MDWWVERERNYLLTTRQREIVALVAQGLSNKAVGRRLNLTEGTVKVHLHQIYKKVGVPNRTALVRWQLDPIGGTPQVAG